MGCCHILASCCRRKSPPFPRLIIRLLVMNLNLEQTSRSTLLRPCTSDRSTGPNLDGYANRLNPEETTLKWTFSRLKTKASNSMKYNRPSGVHENIFQLRQNKRAKRFEYTESDLEIGLIHSPFPAHVNRGTVFSSSLSRWWLK